MNGRQKDECVNACRGCAAASLQCALACLEERDPRSMVRCIALGMACAAACRLAAASIQRGDDNVRDACARAAAACAACGAECDRHPHGHCRRCADACFRCASACRAATPLATRQSWLCAA